MKKLRTNKYNVAKPEDRRYNGITYDSKAEMLHAQKLDLLMRAGVIRGWARQCQFLLGPDFKTRVDFVVWDRSGIAEVHEVKGVETAEFKTVRRLWQKYGPCRMTIYTRTRSGNWSLEVVAT